MFAPNACPLPCPTLANSESRTFAVLVLGARCKSLREHSMTTLWLTEGTLIATCDFKGLWTPPTIKDTPLANSLIDLESKAATSVEAYKKVYNLSQSHCSPPSQEPCGKVDHMAGSSPGSWSFVSGHSAIKSHAAISCSRPLCIA